MSRPYVPGIWAQKYEALPPARKDAVNREVDRVFAERTGVNGKLDPERDSDLVRVWLRIRDAVMSGTVHGISRSFFRVDGLEGSSKDPRHRGWFDVVQAGFLNQLNARPRGIGRLLIVVDTRNNGDAVALSMGVGRAIPSATLKHSSPGFVLELTLRNLRIERLSEKGLNAGAELSFLHLQYNVD